MFNDLHTRFGQMLQVALLCLLISAFYSDRAAAAPASPPMTTTDFEFVSGGKRLSGVIDQPTNGDTRALIIFVHGYGNTDVRGQRPFAGLRLRFADLGIASVVWDKPGQGRSEGTFDSQQPVESSAQEVLDAIQELRRQKISGSKRIGLWGISRAGWIAPLAMARDPGIEFWISVSGVDDQENFRYLLESNLRIEGRSEAEVHSLSAGWMRGFKIFSGGGSFPDFVAATAQLRKDPFFIHLSGTAPPKEEDFHRGQKRYLAGEETVHPHTGLKVYVPHFDKVLRGVDADVLAIFGEIARCRRHPWTPRSGAGPKRRKHCGVRQLSSRCRSRGRRISHLPRQSFRILEYLGCWFCDSRVIPASRISVFSSIRRGTICASSTRKVMLSEPALATLKDR